LDWQDGAADAALWTVPGYRHERELGSGAGGRVVLARHEATGTRVAVRYLIRAMYADPDFCSAFRAEAALLGEVRSPHVARLYEYVESMLGAAIVMEAVEGAPLRALLSAGAPTTPQAALAVLKDSLLGLAAAHEAGVVHRDYKPEKVLITPQGVAKLVDFGVATRSGPAGSPDPAAGTPETLGTLGYMAPERFARQPAAPAADLYAATAAFFECVTGRLPYVGTTAAELMSQHARSPSPDGLAPDSVRPLIRAGLAREPQDRPFGAAVFADELERLARIEFGAHWEERGRRDLAILAAAVPLLLLEGGSGRSSSMSAAATAHPGREAARGAQRAGRRVPKAAVGVGAALLAAAGAAVAVAAVNGSGSGGPSSAAGYVATSEATTSVSPGPSPASPAAGSTSPPPNSSPEAANPGPPAAGIASASGSRSAAARSSSGGPSTGTSTATASPSALKVGSVTITSTGCSGDQGMQATVGVSTNGAADGVLTLSWYYINTNGDKVSSPPLSVKLPSGQTDVKGTYAHNFGGQGSNWGLTVSTTPAAALGNGSSATLITALCELL